MHRNENSGHRWGVILAGGEGVRLQPLTRLVTGDNTPKQFCPLLGGATLLHRTRRRIARSIPEERTVFVLLKSHERFYSKELYGVRDTHKIEQPSNRGTFAAIVYSLVRLVRLDPEAVVAFFPSDHHYSDESKFMAGVELAFGMAEAARETVIALGAAATTPEPSYGWIEAGAKISTDAGTGLLQVKRFWEKPSQRMADVLMDRGCVWNTFVLVGRASAFLAMIQASAPDAFKAFAPLMTIDDGSEEGAANTIYSVVPAADFSTIVLSATPDRLGVLCLGDVGWSDLGDPNRVLSVVCEAGAEPKWVGAWQRNALAASTAC
jgi:mannose-1-phosphate guanylyltransferase